MKRPTTAELKARFAGNELLCKSVINVVSLISNKARFRILCLLREGEYSVNEIVDIIPAGKVSNISQQLKMLTLSGYLESRREDRKIYYSLADKRIRRLIDFLEKQYMKE